MSINLIEQKTKAPKLQEDLLKIVFDNLNTNMKLKHAKALMKVANFPIEFDYKKSNDIFKMRLLIHNSLVEIDKLIRNRLSNSSENPFVTLYDNFLATCKDKIIRNKNLIADLKAINIKANNKIKKLDGLIDSIKEIIRIPISSKESLLISEDKAKSTLRGDGEIPES